MAPQLWTVDAHCHLSDPRVFPERDELLPRLVQNGIKGFLLGGVDPADWERQSELALHFPGRVWQTLGLHPYFVARSESSTLDQAFTQLEKLAPQADALGETGLDFRKTYLEAGKERQREYFRRQLALATKLCKPIVLHIVRAHEEALHDLKNGPSVTGMIHAFHANFKIAQRYLDLGHSLSLGSALLGPSAHDLTETVRKMPLERLLLESDSPDQPPPGLKTHDSNTVWTVAMRVAEIKKLSLEQVVVQTRENLLTLIHKEITL